MLNVLVKNFKDKGGPGKLRSYWEDQVHVVVERKHEASPVYVVRPENGTGRNRILHRNLLLPCNFLPVEEESLENKSKEKQTSRTLKPKARKRRLRREEMDSESSSNDVGCWSGITALPVAPSDQPKYQLRVEAEEFYPRMEEEGVEERVEQSQHDDGGIVEPERELSPGEEVDSDREGSSDEADE